MNKRGDTQHAKLVKTMSHTTPFFHDVIATHERPQGGQGLQSIKKDMKKLGAEDK